MYYEHFEKLCRLKNVRPAEVSKATKISTATLTSWKKGQYTPKQTKLQVIADYFGVSLEYLMTGAERTNNLSECQSDLIMNVTNDLDLRNVLPQYFKLSDNEKKYVIDLIKLLSKEGE